MLVIIRQAQYGKKDAFRVLSPNSITEM